MGVSQGWIRRSGIDPDRCRLNTGIGTETNTRMVQNSGSEFASRARSTGPSKLSADRTQPNTVTASHPTPGLTPCTRGRPRLRGPPQPGCRGLPIPPGRTPPAFARRVVALPGGCLHSDTAFLGRMTVFNSRDLLDGRAFQRDPLSFLQRLGDQDDVVLFKAGLSEFALVRSPELIQRILVTEDSRYGEGKWTLRGKYVMSDCLITREGNSHRERRKLMQPAFGKEALDGCGPVIVRRTLRLSDRWKSKRRNVAQSFDVYPDLAALALEVVGESLFATELDQSSRKTQADATRLWKGSVGRLWAGDC